MFCEDELVDEFKRLAGLKPDARITECHERIDKCLVKASRRN